MAAPVLDLVLPALSETSANLIGQRLRQRMSHLHPHIESTVSFVPAVGQYKAPRIKLSWRELVLVPVNATHLHSNPPQVVQHAAELHRSHPDLAIKVARPTGPAPVLLNLVDARLRLAAHRVHAQELDSLVLSSPDGGDLRGAAMLSKLTRLWSQHHHLPVRIATNRGGATAVEEVGAVISQWEACGFATTRISAFILAGLCTPVPRLLPRRWETTQYLPHSPSNATARQQWGWSHNPPTAHPTHLSSTPTDRLVSSWPKRRSTSDSWGRPSVMSLILSRLLLPGLAAIR